MLVYCYNTIEKKKEIFNLIKYKKLTGVRLEGSGRLAKQFTASRSQFKFEHVGNLLNEESSIRYKSSIILKGNQEPNLQYSVINNKTRIADNK